MISLLVLVPIYFSIYVDFTKFVLVQLFNVQFRAYLRVDSSHSECFLISLVKG